MAGLGVYRQLLANRPLTKLLVGQFISGIGDWLYIVAIFVVIYRETGDAALVGVFGAVRVIPYVGLLRGSPRTATVTAETDGILLALDGPDFLRLVGAGGPLRGRLLGLYSGGATGGTS